MATATQTEQGSLSETDVRRRDSWVRFLQRYVVYVGFVLILVLFAIILRDRGFVTVANLMNIVRQTTPITVMAVGTAFALSAGEIDLSIGSVVALSALVTAILIRDVNVPVAIAGGLGTGLVIGAVNGLLTVRFRIPSFLVTLGSLSIVSGLARSITNLEAVPVQNTTYNAVFGSGSIGPLSTLLFWSIIAIAIGHWVLLHTPFGTHVLATGGNRDAAISVGIRTARVKVAVLTISASTAAIAGMLYTGRLHGARYTLGQADLLTVIAAVVIGGTSLFGGKGSVMGAAVGSLIMGMLSNGLILMGLSVSEQMIARGVIIILAVIISLKELGR